ncbi:PREDICTED: uncharacterized protein LOC104599262 [Nelumbo nucifera]|uniref:Uncharacterized protein LOC104599262 n=1 Tax=Nelumbo nucifera TaxID=4432 RepID=A0A1U8A585_NELNU|nr:PREDICTED: uncharacterized protein LOC104599262 [Nelumbo nucifera]
MEGFQQKRSFGKGKPYHGCAVTLRNISDQKSDINLVLTERVLNEANVQNQKLVDTLKAASDSSSCSSDLSEQGLYGLELRKGSLKQSGGTPIKKLLADELSKEMESRRRPPSVIARLMGLDAMPSPQPVRKQQKKFSENYLQKTASIGLHEKSPPYNVQSFRMDSNKQHEFKDVFEVLETSKMSKKSNPTVQKGKANFKQTDEKMALIREKFMDAKRLSTNEKLQHSKEFHDALEVLDSNKDLFLKFLQEPDSLFTKHLHDLKGVPHTLPAGHITVLKSSNAPKNENNDLYSESGKKAVQWGAMDSHFRHGRAHFTHCHGRPNIYNSYKLSYPQSQGRDETCLLPTRIVVLKPNLGKIPNTEQSLSSPNSSGGFQPDFRKHREFQRLENMELFAEVRERKNTSTNVEFLRHRTRHSRELAKEITREMRHSVNSGSIKVPSSGFRGYAGDESSYSMSGNDSENEFEVMTPISRYFPECTSRCSPSPSYSTESSVTREAKKRLSERWKMTHRFQEVGLVGSGSTLGEMLAVPDRETVPVTLNFENRFRSDRLAMWASPLGISSRDGWKDGFVRSLPRSRSVPASTTFESPMLSVRNRPAASGDRSLVPKETITNPAGHVDGCSMPKDTINQSTHRSRKGSSNQEEYSLFRNLSSRSKKSQASPVTSGESDDSVQEIHISLDELGNNHTVAEQKPIAPGLLVSDVSDKRSVVEEVVVEPVIASLPSGTPEEIEQPLSPSASTVLEKESDFSSHDTNETIAEESSSRSIKGGSLQCPVNETKSPVSPKGTDQTSPVSVLEPPFVEETSSGSECFERISADLHGLRLQLQLLKLESSDAYTEGLGMVVPSDEETGEVSFSVLAEKEKTARALRTEVNRNFSYLVDVLTDSGFYDVDREIIPSMWNSWECPIFPTVFEKLEKKYEEQTWLRSERRLLFDRINAALMEMCCAFMDPHPWVKSLMKKGSFGWERQSLAEELRKMLVSQERDVGVDSPDKALGKMTWLDLGDDIDAVGTEIEKLLLDELVGELVIL